MWYRWNSLAQFNAWHRAVCRELGIPHPNKNAASGKLDESAQWTVAYAEPTIVASDDVRAFLRDQAVERFGVGSAVPADPPFSDDDFLEGGEYVSRSDSGLSLRLLGGRIRAVISNLFN